MHTDIRRALIWQTGTIGGHYPIAPVRPYAPSGSLAVTLISKSKPYSQVTPTMEPMPMYVAYPPNRHVSAKLRAYDERPRTRDTQTLTRFGT